MKKELLTSLLFLALAVPAGAAVRDFGAFIADVPDGWNTAAQNGVAVLTNGDGKAGLSVLVRNAQGRSAQELAQAASMRNNGTAPVPEAGGYSFTIQQDGELAKVYVSVSGSDAMLITVYGENAQTRSILQSIRKK